MIVPAMLMAPMVMAIVRVPMVMAVDILAGPEGIAGLLILFQAGHGSLAGENPLHQRRPHQLYAFLGGLVFFTVEELSPVDPGLLT